MLGWAATNARGWDVHLFGLVTLPAIAPNGSHWGHEAGDIHNVLVYVLLGFIVLHVAAALYHYFVKHDEVVARMLPGSGNFPSSGILRQQTPASESPRAPSWNWVQSVTQMPSRQ